MKRRRRLKLFVYRQHFMYRQDMQYLLWCYSYITKQKFSKLAVACQPSLTEDQDVRYWNGGSAHSCFCYRSSKSQEYLK